MVNLTPLVNTLQTGAPIAILVALVGVIWQYLYRYNRDKLQDRQAERESALEKQRFGYEKLRWREELGRDIMIKLLEERLAAFTQLWTHMEVTSSNANPTVETAKKTAQEIRKWRYEKGGLIAEDVTRDAVYQLQKALLNYDGVRKSKSYRAMREARKLVLRSLRADLGLGKNVSGQTIYEILGERHEIHKLLNKEFPTTDEREP